jgi:hypothetical protein
VAVLWEGLAANGNALVSSLTGFDLQGAPILLFFAFFDQPILKAPFLLGYHKNFLHF